MRFIYKDYFIKGHETLFIIASILTALMIISIIYLGIKVIKKK